MGSTMTASDVEPPSPGPDEPGVHVRGLARAFGDVQALRGVDLHAAPGEVTALVGANGAGKTTLLLVLATLLVPDAGTVRVAGHDPVREPRAVRGRLGWMPDVFGLHEGVTAREYLRFAARAHGLDDTGSRAARGLADAGLEHLADAPVRVLSRGQKQRLGLARALVHDPAVVLLDEPASGLDPRARVDLRDRLRALAARGACVLVSSHVLSDLEEVADAVVVVDAGVTVASRRMDALGAEPSTAGRPWRLRGLDPAALVAWLDSRGHDPRPAGSAGVDVLLPGEPEAARLLAALVRDGVAVTSCAPVGGALEQAYLGWTGGTATARPPSTGQDA